MKTWITDERNNRASIERWGSEGAARASLATLTNCSDCSDCFGCSGCSDCSDCSGCSGCSDCFRCFRCSGCSGCFRCSRCSGMSVQKLDVGIPIIEDIHRKVYEAASKEGCLNMDTWHSCETTHCRAGWVVHLAGELGYALEKKTSPLFAAQQIYKASGYKISPVRFFDNNEKALADMKSLAETQSK